MVITIIEFVDYDIDPAMITVKWKIAQECFRYFGGKNEKIIIPMHNIFRITEYED